MKSDLLFVVAILSALPHGATAQSSMSSTVQGMTVILLGDAQQELTETAAGADVMIDGLGVVISPTEITLNGQIYGLTDPSEIVIDRTGYGLKIRADGVLVAAISELAGLEAAAAAA